MTLSRERETRARRTLELWDSSSTARKASLKIGKVRRRAHAALKVRGRSGTFFTLPAESGAGVPTRLTHSPSSRPSLPRVVTAHCRHRAAMPHLVAAAATLTRVATTTAHVVSAHVATVPLSRAAPSTSRRAPPSSSSPPSSSPPSSCTPSRRARRRSIDRVAPCPRATSRNSASDAWLRRSAAATAVAALAASTRLLTYLLTYLLTNSAMVRPASRCQGYTSTPLVSPLAAITGVSLETAELLAPPGTSPPPSSSRRPKMRWRTLHTLKSGRRVGNCKACEACEALLLLCFLLCHEGNNLLTYCHERGDIAHILSAQNRERRTPREAWGLPHSRLVLG